ncbi:MAG: hypothetical protein N2Z20_02265 [Elusimicrobiales bacterium]|nr:hypothetical protein [Elusimicrobiales bacterium]
MKFILLSIFFILQIQKLSTQDINKIYDEGIKSWLDGRIDDAIGNFEYVVHTSTDTNQVVQAATDLIVLLNEKGENSTAIAYADKILAIDHNNPFVLLEKSYSKMLINDMIGAKKELNELLATTSDIDKIYTSKFFKAIVEAHISGFENASKEIESVYRNYHPLLAPSAYLMAEYIKPFKKMASVNFLKDSLIYDSKNIQALIDLANIYEETKYYTQSWQAYFTLREIEGKDSYAYFKSEKLIKKINKNPDNIFLWSRLGWPVHENPLIHKESQNIRIALYSDKLANQPPIVSFYIISNTDFEITEPTPQKKFNGKRNMQYGVFYNLINKQIEIRDNYSTTIYATRKNIEIKPLNPGGVILIKSPTFKDDVIGINRGDKEVSGKLLVKLSTDGMRIINYTYIEHILPSIVQTTEGPKDDDRALKALTITIRTMLHRKINPNNNYDITDQEEKLEFKGIQFEKEKTVLAATETKDILIKKGQELYPANYVINTANIVNAIPQTQTLFPKKLSPSSLKNWLMFDFMKNSHYSTPLNVVDISNISWFLILKPYWIEERVNTKYKVGKIKNIIILKRDEIGRVLSIKIEGTANDVIIEGEKEINKILAAGTLRSNLFIIFQIKKGKNPIYFILKGIGTGNFSGLCIYGSDYLAKNMDFNHIQILKYYFPNGMLTIK